jgi:3-hydroxyethyl bacteriochlorophyllide a dehydrogenase
MLEFLVSETLMQATAVIFDKPGQLRLGTVATIEPRPTDVVVEIDFTGISTGTERLLWNGRMPAFPGLGYPLVPGYEAVGRVVHAGAESGRAIGDNVFVPGTSGYVDVKGLFGGSASILVADAARILPVPSNLGERATLMALAATACHVVSAPGAGCPDLIVGHGVLGRLLARIVIAAGGPAPVVWECAPSRQSGAMGYAVVAPQDDPRRDYKSIVDVSGDASLLDSLIQRCARGGEIVLAGFYEDRPSFDFAPAFMREVRLRISAEWAPPDLQTALALIDQGRLSLDGLVSDCRPAEAAAEAYPSAFLDPQCLKMTLDWRTLQ